MSNKAKYRPSMTAREIEHVISLCGANPSEDSYYVLAKFLPLRDKIANNGIAPSYVTKATILTTAAQAPAKSKAQSLQEDMQRLQGINARYEAGEEFNDKELYEILTYRAINNIATEEENIKFVELMMTQTNPVEADIEASEPVKKKGLTADIDNIC